METNLLYQRKLKITKNEINPFSIHEMRKNGKEMLSHSTHSQIIEKTKMADQDEGTSLYTEGFIEGKGRVLIASQVQS